MVNPAITAALIAASNREATAQHIEGRLKKAGALSRGSATRLELSDKEQELLDQAVANGTVQRTEDGRLYLNERVVADRAEGQGLMAVLIILALVSVIASVAVLAARASG